MNNVNPIYNIIKDYLLYNKEDSLTLNLCYSILWTIPEKYTLLKQVIENPFLNKNDDWSKSPSINTFFKIFTRLQRTHFAIHRFIWIWRFRRARVYNTEDLFMTPIADGQKGTITILENNTKYIFLIRELLNSIQTNLSNCSHFFPDIKPCKNPYTNLPLKKSNLYTIYFKIRESGYKLPILFENFFRDSFDLQRFSRRNSFLINEEYLNQYSKTNLNIHNIREWIDEMFSNHKLELNIHEDFPRYRLIEIMLPYIDLYNKSQYYMNTNKSERAYRSLHHKLHRFLEYNPSFGRQKINIITKYDENINKFITEKITSYNDNYPLFEEPNKIPFMTNHIESITIRTVGYNYSNTQNPVFFHDDSEEEEEEDEEPIFENQIQQRDTNTPILYDSSSDDSIESE
jgi:hypothetical protein